jgi:beta-1,4-mannosyl-glycoprotein beta-1,4-N-acetylglucosaminyltransferase
MTTVRNYTDPNALRQHGNRYRMKDIHCAGWHFSWLGDTEKIIAKIESTAHREIDNPMIKDRAHIEECLRTGKDILNRPGYEWQFLNDMNYPEYVIGNIERFGKYFSPRRA